MRILVLDDDPTLRRELSSFLGLNGHESIEAATLGQAREALARADARPDLVLADLYLAEERGTAIIADAKLIPVVMISGAGGIREAVDSLKLGAWDFLEKPIDPDRLLGLLRNLDRGLRAERGVAALRAAWLAEHAAFAPRSPFEAALTEAEGVAASPLSVLITGPSGSGKEVIARWIHYCSPRVGGPLVAVNCAALPPELAESLLFGSARGSYTGADSERPGWFQAARGGTLFLDEVGELPLPIQAKLLRAVESGEVQRLGSTVLERISLRLVAATNRDLEAEVEAGRFRQDLYWRLAQATIRLPPLSERRGDIPLLARWFLAASGREAGGAPEGRRIEFDEEALSWLSAQSWPGNVRELKNLVERARWFAPGPRIGVADLRGRGGPSQLPTARPDSGLSASAPHLDAEGTTRPLKEAKQAFERAYIIRVLEGCQGSVTQAAGILGLLPNNLSRKLGELGIRLGR